MLAHEVLEQGKLYHVLALGDTDALAERADGHGRVATTAHPGDGRHARIIPAADKLFLHEAQQLSLAHHGVRQVKPRELVLVRQGLLQVERFEDPVVQRPVHLELERADRVRDALDVVA